MLAYSRPGTILTFGMTMYFSSQFSFHFHCSLRLGSYQRLWTTRTIYKNLLRMCWHINTLTCNLKSVLLSLLTSNSVGIVIPFSLCFQQLFKLKWVKSWSRSVVSDSLRPHGHQAPPSVGFSRQEYWSGLPFPSPWNLPDPGIEPVSLASSASAGGFLTTL